MLPAKLGALCVSEQRCPAPGSPARTRDASRGGRGLDAAPVSAAASPRYRWRTDLLLLAHPLPRTKAAPSFAVGPPLAFCRPWVQSLRSRCQRCRRCRCGQRTLAWRCARWQAARPRWRGARRGGSQRAAGRGTRARQSQPPLGRCRPVRLSLDATVCDDDSYSILIHVALPLTYTAYLALFFTPCLPNLVHCVVGQCSNNMSSRG